MAQNISWIPPDNTNVGSVLIYRANSTYDDSLGSRSIIATIDATSGGDWVTTYSDANGTEDSIYRVQFYDGVGSSEISDAIGRNYGDQLASFKEVLFEARLGTNYDIGSYDVFQSIEDASQTVFQNYGDPVKQTTFYLDGKTGISGQVYDFTGKQGPVYQVREIFVNASQPRLVSNTDFEVDYNNGMIKFTDEFIGSYQGNNVYVNWVPQIVNNLVKYMAAKNLLDGEMILTGAGTLDNPKITYLQSKIDRAVDAYRPKGVYSAKLNHSVGGYEFISQPIQRNHFYFSN